MHGVARGFVIVALYPLIGAFRLRCVNEPPRTRRSGTIFRRACTMQADLCVSFWDSGCITTDHYLCLVVVQPLIDFNFPEDARGNAERPAVEFWGEIGEHHEVVRVSRRAFQSGPPPSGVWKPTTSNEPGSRASPSRS